MAAPSGTKWGSIAGGYGRIGLYITTSSTNTQTTATIDIWFWSKYSVQDVSNTLYYADQQTNPTTAHGSVTINTTVDSGGGWSESNQVRIANGIKVTHSRGHSDVNWVFGARLTGIEAVGATMQVSTTWKCPAKPKYTISYNAAGGSGAPGAQTKWYGETLVLSATRPSRTGYTFAGWGVYEGDPSVNYQPGANYTDKQGGTLWAIWTKNNYTVTFNAQGGTVSPESRNVPYNDAVGTLPTPSRPNYTFLGWYTGTNGSGSRVYTTTKITGNITFYAAWRLNSFTVWFDAQGGSISEITRTVNYGAQVGALPTPTRQYHTFLGWYTGTNGTGSRVSSTTVITREIVFYVYWRRDSVVYIKNNGAWKRGTPYVRVNGVWRRGTACVKSGGIWKRGIGK